MHQRVPRWHFLFTSSNTYDVGRIVYV